MSLTGGGERKQEEGDEMWRVFCTLALFMLLLAGCVPARADCPAGAVKWNNGHCYEAVLAPGVSWDQAQSACVVRGGHLATITSAEENAFVFSLVSGNPSFGTVPFKLMPPFSCGIVPSQQLMREGISWQIMNH